ncbi:MAG: hypothetical protein Q7S20_12420 [Gemmatimonadaceae bacterium]|nr:hypothetical protein [Gemmatimonadaceae bacterium]
MEATGSAVTLGTIGQIAINVHDLWISFYRDSEDNHFALMSEVPRA